jgi:hypothetical protein
MKFTKGSNKNGTYGIHILATSPLTDPEKFTMNSISKNDTNNISIFFLWLTIKYIKVSVNGIPKNIKKSYKL